MHPFWFWAPMFTQHQVAPRWIFPQWHRPKQILSVKRSCPFLHFKLLYTSLTRKLLFWKAVHMRMSYCTFRHSKGHASGIIIGNEVGVVCRILCYSEMQKLSCVQGFCAAPCGPEKNTLHVQGSTGLQVPAQAICDVGHHISSYMGNTLLIRIIEFYLVIYIRLTFPKI